MTARPFVAVVHLTNDFGDPSRVVHVLGPFANRTAAENAGREAAGAVDAFSRPGAYPADYTVRQLWRDVVDIVANTDAPCKRGSPIDDHGSTYDNSGTRGPFPTVHHDEPEELAP